MPGRVAETAKMVAELDLKTQKFTKGVSTAVGSLGKLTGSVARSRAVAVSLGVGLEHAAEFGLRALGGAVTGGLQSLADLESATTSVDGAIKQMGLTGQVTADQIAGWANEVEANVQAAFDDKDITRATATLIRFGHITPSAIRPAMQVITDLAVKTGDVDSAANLLGRALADPAKAAGKLSRAGVILTKTQQDQIKAFVKAGKVGKAQALILDAVATSTKGAAAASQGPYQDSINTLRDVTEDAQKALATGFLPVIMRVRDILSKELAKPEVLANIRRFGEGLAGGLSKLVDVIQKVNWGSVVSRIAGVFHTIEGVISKIKAGWDKLPEPVQNLILTGLIADRTVKFLFGFSPSASIGSTIFKGAEGLITGAVSAGVGKGVGAAIATAGLGKLFVQPVFVTNPGFGLPIPGGPGGPPVPVPGWSPTAGGTGGLMGLLKGIPIIGAALAGAEFANIAAPIIAEKVKGIVPETTGDIAGGATKAIVGALTGPLGFPNLISGIQDIAGNIGRLIPLIDANKPPAPGLSGHDLFDPTTGRVPVRSGLGGHDIEAITTAINRVADVQQTKLATIATGIQTAAATRDKETSSAIDSLVAKLPTGKQMDDQTFAQAIADHISAITPKFVPTVKLDASQITDLRDPAIHTAEAISKAAAQRDSEITSALRRLTAERPDFIIDAANRRDAETSAAIAGLAGNFAPLAKTSDIAPIAKTSDIDGLRIASVTATDATSVAVSNTSAAVTALEQSAIPAINISGALTAIAARTAGFVAASAATMAGFGVARQVFATGIGIEGAIAANRPITNVKVEISATNVTKVNVVEDRGGSRSGSRDGEGGGGPGQS